VNEPATAEATISHLPLKAAMMAAVEILLTAPQRSATTPWNQGSTSCARSSARQSSRAAAPAKYRRVAEMLRGQIIGATLPPGALAPGGGAPEGGADARAFRLSLGACMCLGRELPRIVRDNGLISALLLLFGTG
jgi:hypothetical protein